MPRRRVLVHCNAGSVIGMGHLMRCIALAEQAADAGWGVLFVGDLTDVAISLVAENVTTAEFEVVRHDAQHDWFARRLEAIAPDVVHLDSYSEQADAVPRGSHLLSNMQDDKFGRRAADLAVDANLGAESRYIPGLADMALLGIEYAQIRRQVLRQRHVAPPRSDVPRVLVVIGGTDPLGLTPSVLAAVQGWKRSVALTVVTQESQRRTVMHQVRASHHEVRVVPVVGDLPAVARTYDLVISASGTSVWDFACMGVPMALLCVTENQRAGYEAALAAGLAYGLGGPALGDMAGHVQRLEDRLHDGDGMAAMAARGRETVDGLGALRLLDQWERMLRTRGCPN